MKEIVKQHNDARDLQFQAACVRDVICHARSEEVRAGLEQVVKVLEWMARGELAFRELVRIRTECPQLFEAIQAVKSAFPDARLDRISSAAGKPKPPGRDEGCPSAALPGGVSLDELLADSDGWDMAAELVRSGQVPADRMAEIARSHPEFWGTL